MKTVLSLREYEDVLDPADIYSLLGKYQIEVSFLMRTLFSLWECEDVLDSADIYPLLGKYIY